jgi:hypothetical protein
MAPCLYHYTDSKAQTQASRRGGKGEETQCSSHLLQTLWDSNTVFGLYPVRSRPLTPLPPVRSTLQDAAARVVSDPGGAPRARVEQMGDRGVSAVCVWRPSFRWCLSWQHHTAPHVPSVKWTRRVCVCRELASRDEGWCRSAVRAPSVPNTSTQSATSCQLPCLLCVAFLLG